MGEFFFTSWVNILVPLSNICYLLIKKEDFLEAIFYGPLLASL